ncbi:RRQRL motif-containing zinc-binding protein [Streptomyces chartreusis]|uniref:RRQRL motif-containing zinc-binding protein n=1 Tax=Streptomyces chartreusis TaxID=1969 RepID=UPI0019A2E8FC|nr:RRQRL motif-containing zinc-binding protein [Streptomyces chartreusis]GGX58473.1 hypothetical protein GCM10010321_89180 [Streptomyces chartreusis]
MLTSQPRRTLDRPNPVALTTKATPEATSPAASDPALAKEEVVLRDVDLYADPSGAIPTYKWRQAPKGLATRRQLRAMGLSRGRGNDPVAQIECRGGKRVAYLYRIDLAVPKRVPTLAQEAALDKAMARRQTCPKCRRRYHRCLPLRKLGSCLECFDGTPADPRDYTAATTEWLPAA